MIRPKSKHVEEIDSVVSVDLEHSELLVQHHQQTEVLAQWSFSASYCPSKTKWSWERWSSLEFSEIWDAEEWQRCFRRKNIHSEGKVQSTKRQSAGPTLRGRSWRHVNRLSPPGVSICHVLSCSVKNLEISSAVCETGYQSQRKCVHRWPLLYVIWKSISNMNISHSNKTVFPLTPQKKIKLGAEKISRGFGAKEWWPLLHRPISTQRTSVFGSCWKLGPIAHHTQLKSLWNCLWLKLGPKYRRRSCVQQLRVSENEFSE